MHRKAEPKNIVIIRFSAMGDVVLTVPVIKSLLQKYPDVQVSVLTRPFFQPFFQNIPQVTCFPVDLKEKHKGISGLKKLVTELTTTQKVDAVIDLHSVLRSWVLGFFFRIKGIPVYRIDKGRKEKQKFVSQKILQALPHTTERYQKTLQKAGFNFPLEKELLNVFKPLHTADNLLKIGIAPFAAHQSKQWGTSKIYELIETLTTKYGSLQFYLFGGGKPEVEHLNKIADYYNNVENLAGKMSLQEEIQKISELDLFISMDSGNMHIATLTGIPVVSIWGGTHPDIGFSGLYQPEENHIQLPISEITCRPCSVFGTSKCDHPLPFACMQELSVAKVVARIDQLLKTD